MDERAWRGHFRLLEKTPGTVSFSDLREMAPNTFIYTVPQWQIRTAVVLLKKMEKKNACIQTLEEAVRGPLVPKIDGVNNSGEYHGLFTSFNVCHKSLDTVLDIGPRRPGPSVCVHRHPYPSAQ